MELDKWKSTVYRYIDNDQIVKESEENYNTVENERKLENVRLKKSNVNFKVIENGRILRKKG